MPYHHQLALAMSSSFSAIVILSPLLIAVAVAASAASFADVDDSSLLISSSSSSSSSNQREFDYFSLALQWPGTYCRNTHKCCQKNGCCRNSGPPKHFTIHGLWPDYNDGSWPSCCTKSEFNENEISTLRKALDEYWPSLSCGSPTSCHGHKGSFWGHEWEKHGTCASPVVHDEYSYFLTGLNIYFKYNVTQVLSEAGYVPSNSEKYPLGGIISAIENAFHLSPTVVCSGDAVKELRLCFYKNFQPRDCATDSRIKELADYSKTSCPKYVSLPTYDSLGLGNVGAYKSIAI